MEATLEVITPDDQIFKYQRTGESDELINQYANFLHKYYALIQFNSIDFSNYDIRCFLACYIADEAVGKELRRGKSLSPETVTIAYKALQSIRHKLRNHTYEELKHELLIPFLQVAQRYKQLQVGFDKYLYKAYKYVLKRHLDDMKWDALDHSGLMYKDTAIEGDFEEVVYDEFTLEMDEAYELCDPRWIHGNKSRKPFADLKSHERYILVKYYYESHTDKEIARMLPYNPKSIHRIRTRLVKQFKELYTQGELKCLRI